MIYSGLVRHSGVFSVCLVGAKDKQEAMAKIMHLFSHHDVDSVHISRIEDKMLGKTSDGLLETYYRGGMVLGSSENIE